MLNNINNSEISNFLKAVTHVAKGARFVDDEDELLTMVNFEEITDTAEPVSNFRPVDAITNKAAGKEYNTPYGVVVERNGVQRHKGDSRRTMWIGRTNGNEFTIVAFR